MERKEFEDIVKNYFKSKGFEKKGVRYFLNSDDFLCEIYVQKSYYGAVFYLNYDFWLGKFEKPYVIDRGGVATRTPDVGYRFYFTENDGYSCQYLNYNEEQLIEILNENFALRILPPFKEGKKYLLEHYGTLYGSVLPEEKIRPLLLED